MLASIIPPKFQIPWGNAAGGAFIRPIPTASQIGTVPGAASLTDGWPPLTATPVAAGGIPPDVRDANGILNQATAWNRWQAAGGPIPYDATFQAAIGGYPRGALIASVSTLGLYWLSLNDNNTTNPDTGGTGWQRFPLPPGAAAANVGPLGGALSGTLPNPSLAAGSAASNLGAAGGDLQGTYPNPTFNLGIAHTWNAVQGFAVSPFLNNGVPLQGKDPGGVVRNLVDYSSDEYVNMWGATNGWRVLSKNGALQNVLVDDGGNVTVRGNLTSNGQVYGNTVVGATVSSNGGMSAAGNIAAGGQVSGASVSSTGSISATLDVTASRNIGASGQVSGNTVVANGITSNGNVNAAGQTSGNTVVSTTSVTANNGNVTASNGRLRASFGASGGDNNTAPILGDFPFQYVSGLGYNGYYYRLPNGVIVQGGVITTASGNQDLYTFPIAFPNNCIAFVCSDNGPGMADTGGSPWSGNPLAVFQIWAGYNGVYPNPPTYRPGVGVEFIAIGY